MASCREHPCPSASVRVEPDRGRLNQKRSCRNEGFPRLQDGPRARLEEWVAEAPEGCLLALWPEP